MKLRQNYEEKSRGINKFLRVQGSKFSSFSGSGIKLLGKNMGSFTKKYTSLRPCEYSTNWVDCKSNKSNQIKCWFLRRGENRSSQRKTSRSSVENQQTQPTYDAGSGSRTRDTLVEGERSRHCANPAPIAVVNTN